MSLEPMPDLPLKAPVRKNRTVPKATWDERKKAAEKKVKQAQSSTAKRKASPLQGGAYKESQHPRDRLGRFVVKALKSTGKAIARTAKGTAKAVKSAHKTVKRVQANGRKRASLEHRERKLDLHKREQAAGIGRKKATRKKATPVKKQVRRKRK